MNPEELDEQFQAMESDSQVKAAAAGTPPAPPVRRRITTAQVKKELDELTELIDVNVFDWLEKLDTRVRHFENAEAEKPDSAAEDTAAHFKRLEDFIGNSTVKNISEMKARLDALEENTISDRVHVNKGVLDRLVSLENATSALADVARSIIDDVERLQPAKAEEIEFAKPPVAIHDQPVQTADIAAVASVCLTMNDVLMIARALRDSPDLEMMDKNEILNIACRSAGVQVTHGLQIRAGIHEGGA